jgi:hypothetical protein
MKKRKGGPHPPMTETELAIRADLRAQARAKLARSIGCPPDRVQWQEVAHAIGVRPAWIGASERRPAVDAALRRYIEADPNP